MCTRKNFGKFTFFYLERRHEDTTLTSGLMSFTFLASCIEDSPGILMFDTIRKKSCALDLDLSSTSSEPVNPSTDNPFFRRHFLRTWTMSGSSSTTNVLDAILLPLPSCGHYYRSDRSILSTFPAHLYYFYGRSPSYYGRILT
jgi:hypothetical protein